MPARRKLGTVYVKSPAQLTGKWLVDNSSKVIFSAFYCLLWLAAFFLLVSIVNFLGSEIAEVWERGIPTVKLYNHPYAVPVKVLGMIAVIIYVFRDSRTK